jgi:hypothetical protein
VRRSNQPDTTRLTLVLQTMGVTPGRALVESLQVSQPTLSRWLTQLGPAVERIGTARKTTYALRRNVRNLGTAWPLHRIDETGRPHVLGDLRALHGGCRYLPSGNAPGWLTREYPTGVFPGLPFFLRDSAPQGYVGRAIARDAAARLGVPDDPRNWSDDDLLAYLLTAGDDLPGDVILGDRSLEQALRRPDTVPDTAIAADDRASQYPERAAAAQRGEVFGSSAGGEQPKFLVIVHRPDGAFVPVLVKFSASERSPVSERWADLLVCEHLASQILAAYGLPSVRTELWDAGGRRFLEVERFDRTHAGGRRGVLSLGAVEDGLGEGRGADWTASAGQLESAGWLAPDQARELRWRWCFGNLIGNSDMHRSNTSVEFGDGVPFRLTPSYDMLPMAYAPSAQGDLGTRVLDPRPPLPMVSSVWPEAAAAALDFWSKVAADERISLEFRALATGAGATIQRMLARFG